MNVKEVLTRDITLEKPRRWFMGVKLPLLALGLVIVYWFGLMHFYFEEVNCKRYGEAYEAGAVVNTEATYIRVPARHRGSEHYYRYEVSPDLVENGTVTVYYNEKAKGWLIPKTTTEWVVWYAVGIFMMVTVLCWLGKALYDKYREVKIKENLER